MFKRRAGLIKATSAPIDLLAEFWGRNRGQRLLKKSTDILSEKNALFQDVVHHNELIFHSSIQNDMVARVLKYF